ncbi:MAG: sulfite exporter TauE/SafE family protein [Candidatus Hydrogenedentes bacterium]|nr:sulfite exporter TauE/SafE family protein [Candidatus Hydrogenedentota bacterium]
MPGFSIEFAVGMAVLGIGVGLISSALGLGGGILMVPAFMTFVAGMDARTAKGTSLFIIFFVVILNTWRLRTRIDKDLWRLAFVMALGSIVGGYIGGWVTSLMPDDVVLWIFIAFLVVAALRTFLIRPRVVHAEEVRRRTPATIAIGAVSGIVGGATGTGGGLVLIPLALIAGVVTNERAVALSNMVMIATGFAGTVAHLRAEASLDLPYTMGHVNFALAPLVFIGAQIAGPPGIRLERMLTLPRRKLIMGVLLLVISVRLAYQALR